MIVLATDSMTRCPRCHDIRPRGVRYEDAQLVAICGPCGHPLLDAIDQPPKHQLDLPELRALQLETPEPRPKFGGGLTGDELLDAHIMRLRRAGMRQAAIAEHIGVPETTYRRWLAKARNGDEEMIGKLREWLGAIDA